MWSTNSSIEKISPLYSRGRHGRDRMYNYLCNQCLSPLKLWGWIPFRRGVLDTTLCDQVCQWLMTGRWFSPGTPVSSTNKTDCHYITEILLIVALNTINLTPNQPFLRSLWTIHTCKDFWVRFVHWNSMIKVNKVTYVVRVKCFLMFMNGLSQVSFHLFYSSTSSSD